MASPTMTTEARLAALLSAPPNVLTAVDAALTNKTNGNQLSGLRLYRMCEAAEALNVSRCSLWRLCKENRIRTVETRKGSRRIPEAELRRFARGEA